MEHTSPFAIENAFNTLFQENLYEAQRTDCTDSKQLEDIIFEAANQVIEFEENTFDSYQYLTEKGFQYLNKSQEKGKRRKAITSK